MIELIKMLTRLPPLILYFKGKIQLVMMMAMMLKIDHAGDDDGGGDNDDGDDDDGDDVEDRSCRR